MNLGLGRTCRENGRVIAGSLGILVSLLTLKVFFNFFFNSYDIPTRYMILSIISTFLNSGSFSRKGDSAEYYCKKQYK